MHICLKRNPAQESGQKESAARSKSSLQEWTEAGAREGPGEGAGEGVGEGAGEGAGKGAGEGAGEGAKVWTLTRLRS